LNMSSGLVTKLRHTRYRRLLSPYIDAELDRVARRRIESHLGACARCRAEYEHLVFASKALSNLSLPSKPVVRRPVWVRQLALGVKPTRNRKFWPLLAVASAAVVMMIVGVIAWRHSRWHNASWEVVRLAGSPAVGQARIDRTARLHTGELIETDETARAMIQVGAIGQVELDPNTRVRLIKASPFEHRLSLERGKLHATILAPPRLFFVDTPSAVAIDLGCSYSLEVGESGESLLQVKAGWVSLVLGGREAMVPAGAMCRTRPGVGPGTPYLEDSSDHFQASLARLDFENGGEDALSRVLAESRFRDTLTLWHLLSRVDGRERVRVYDRLAELAPPPDVVTREGALALDRWMLDVWREKLEYVSVGVNPSNAPAAAGSLTPVGVMRAARFAHTATLLADGRVLIAGGRETRGGILASAEIFDPTTGRFTETGGMTTRRVGHTATLLADGRVLVAGGSDGDFFYGSLASAEIFDPTTGRFTETARMNAERLAHRATLLRDGRVLVTGGQGREPATLDTAEIYDPARERFTRIASMTAKRADHTATLLTDGRVLIAGGAGARNQPVMITSSAEVFDPAKGSFTPTGGMSIVRHKHSATLMPDGRVVVIGGSDARLWQGRYDSAEIYDPASGRFKTTGSLSTARYKIRDAVVMLRDGRVLVAGGGARAEVYDPRTGLFSTIKDGLGAARFYATATLLANGDVLIVGGYSGDYYASVSGNADAWVYHPE
jgi:putative zinc finger protein/galactose oxidase-like protein/FecR-like protein/Kelch motif protein